MENSLSALAKKMIEDRILGEVRKLLREKASTLFLSSVLPPAPLAEEGPGLRVEADLKLSVRFVKIDCTIQMGVNSERKFLALENEEQTFSICTGFRLRKPGELSGSDQMVLNLEKLELGGSLGGIEFSKMMLGAGATIHSLELCATLSGSGSGVWL